MQFELHGRSEPDAETILLSAGLGGLGAFWKPQVAALGARYRIVTYDQRGTGRNRAELPDDYRISAMADDVIGIIDQLGIGRCHVMGHALGGLVGLELARRQPHRLRKLVLVNAWAKADPHTLNCFAVRKDLLLNSGVEAYVRAQPIFLFPAPWLSRHAGRVAAETAEGVRHFQGAETLLRRIGALSAFDIADRLGDIHVPTLVAASRDDVLVPWTCSQVLAEAMPAARLSLTAEGGHGFTVTEPEAFNTLVLDFLGEQAG
ncbi:MAG: pyrimidine utilization protein D [Phreatobacter sp.]